MHTGMKRDAFQNAWLQQFAAGITQKEIQEKVFRMGNFIWHIFSWDLVDSGDYLTGDRARQAFDRADKTGAWYLLPFDKKHGLRQLTCLDVTAAQLEEKTEIYLVAADLSWTYIKTHEGDLCGPYFYRKS